MTIAGEISEKKAYVKPDSLSGVFHTWLVIFTPGFDICVSYCCLLPSNQFPYVKSLTFCQREKKGKIKVDIYVHVQNDLLINYPHFLNAAGALMLTCDYPTVIRQVNILGQ